MPPISFGGIASGLPPNMVEQIMASERIPIQTLEGKKEGINAKMSLVGDLETRLRSVGDTLGNIVGAGGFKDYSLELSQEGIVAGTVDVDNAQTGSWSIEVLKLPVSAGTVTNGFPDRDRTQVGVGYLKFETPEGTKEVYLNDTNNTLSGVARAINEAGVGVKASIVADADDSDYPHKLILSSDKYGNNNDIKFPTVYLLDGDHDFFFENQRQAENGKIKMNGFEIEVDAKKLESLVPGVNLRLLSAEPGKEVTVAVSENYEAIKGKMSEFVDSMNSVLGFIQQQNAMDENTDTTKTLGGDSMLRSVELRLKNMLQSGSYSSKPGVHRLSDLGVEFNRSGTLDFKQEKFDQVLQSNPSGVVKFLRGDGSRGSGFITKVRDMIKNNVNTQYGVIANRKSGLENNLRRIDQSIENKERLLAQKEDGLRRKFARLEETMGKLKAQGGAVAAMNSGGAGGVGLQFG